LPNSLKRIHRKVKKDKINHLYGKIFLGVSSPKNLIKEEGG
jgi:hypothetical protein